MRSEKKQNTTASKHSTKKEGNNKTGRELTEEKTTPGRRRKPRTLQMQKTKKQIKIKQNDKMQTTQRTETRKEEKEARD